MLRIDPKLVPPEPLAAAPRQDSIDAAGVSSSPGPQRLKTLVETEHLRAWCLPGRVLDAGSAHAHIGGAIAAAGIRVEYDRGAPFPDAAFDTVVAIDSLRAATWTARCDAFLRAARPGGHVIVNVESLEHAEAVRRARGGDAASRSALLPCVNVDTIVEFARSRGACVRAIIPYGAVFGRLIENRWFGDGSQARADRLERLVSWIGADEELFALAAFIEQRVIAALPPSCAARTIVVFAREPATAGEAADVARFARLDAAIASRWLDVEEIAAAHPGGAPVWRTELADAVAGERACSFAAALYAFARCGPLWPGLAAHVPPALLRACARASRFGQTEAEATRLAALWNDAVGSTLVINGVWLGAALAPSLQREITAALRATR